MEASSIHERHKRALERIRDAERAAGRPEGSVHLLAVSKTQPASAVREAYELGQRDFGENYVQELTAKAEQLADLEGLRWHVIGHLQTNKVRAIVPLASAVHSVGSLRLIEELDRRMVTHRDVNRPNPDDPEATTEPLTIFIEVNVGGEEQKSGCRPEETAALLDAARTARHLRPVGLMTIPPLGGSPGDSRPYFEKLRRLRDDLGGETVLPELSMGMSADCEEAILCGATWVRLGTALFGPRPLKTS